MAGLTMHLSVSVGLLNRRLMAPTDAQCMHDSCIHPVVDNTTRIVEGSQQVTLARRW